MKPILAAAILASGLLMESCIVQQPPQQQQQNSQQQQYYSQPQGQVYYYEYRNWEGPGWYYGIYFRNHDRYRHWYNQRKTRRYYYRGGYAYPAPPQSGRRGQNTEQQQSLPRRGRLGQIQPAQPQKQPGPQQSPYRQQPQQRQNQQSPYRQQPQQRQSTQYGTNSSQMRMDQRNQP